MIKAVIPLVLTIFVSAPGSAQTVIYSWRDRAGAVHIVDDLNKVPRDYREDMKIYRIPSTRRARKPQSKASSQPVAEVKEGEEKPLEGKGRGEKMDEVSGSITALEERLEQLKQEREKQRIYIIKQRAKGHPVVRENREIEEIDREIETLGDQLGEKMETLRTIEQEGSRNGGQ